MSANNKKRNVLGVRHDSKIKKNRTGNICEPSNKLRRKTGSESDGEEDEAETSFRTLSSTIGMDVDGNTLGLDSDGKEGNYSDESDTNPEAELSFLEDEDDDEIDDSLVYDESTSSHYVLEGDEDILIQKFLQSDKSSTKTLADLILEKLQEKDIEKASSSNNILKSSPEPFPPKVIEVYTSVGNMLQHYKSGKLPKALKMLPHLKNWEGVLWLTRPDMWSPIATYCVTRIFVSNLKVKMVQRYLNLVLLEKCRDDIASHGKLNYHLYLALKKALFKPAAFYKGILLPLAQSRTCTLREAVIIGSVLNKVSIPSMHSAAALLRLAEMCYSGSTSVFIKTLLIKKYALPSRVIDALVTHFTNFSTEKRALPVIWHQSLLIFVQRYKLEFSVPQRENLLNLIKVHGHHEISLEVRRELLISRS